MRLQYEIARYSDDESLFAWNDPGLQSAGMFAQSPAGFGDSGNVVSRTFPQWYRPPWSVTNRGLAISLAVKRHLTSVSAFELAPLHCVRIGNNDPIAIQLLRISRDNLVRPGVGEIVLGKSPLTHIYEDPDYELRTVYIKQVIKFADPSSQVDKYNPEIYSFNFIEALSVTQSHQFLLRDPLLSDPTLASWGAGSLTIGHGYAAFRCQTTNKQLMSIGLGEDFLLILRVQRVSASLDVIFQNSSKRSIGGMNILYSISSQYGPPESWAISGSQRFSGLLPNQRNLHVYLRKGTRPGQKHYDVEIHISNPAVAVVKSSEMIVNKSQSDKAKRTWLAKHLRNKNKS